MLHTHPKVLIRGKYQKTSTQCGNPKSAILSSYLHKLGCKDSKVLDCANQLHILHKEKIHPNLTKLFPLYSVLSHKGKKTLNLTFEDLKKYQLYPFFSFAIMISNSFYFFSLSIGRSYPKFETPLLSGAKLPVLLC